MKINKFFFILIQIALCLILLSCNAPHYQDYPVLGTTEFIADSCMIREGKPAIQSMEGKEVYPLPADAFDVYEDLIAEGDILNIVIHHPSRSDLMASIQAVNTGMGGFQVMNGAISLPCIDDPIVVAGKPLSEARRTIRDRFREQINDVDVFISYKERLSHHIELTGLGRGANIPVNGNIRLYEVLVSVNPPPDANLFASYVLRDGVQLNVDLYKLIHEGDMSQNIVMKAGDKIFIASPADGVLLVMGEVRLPRAVPVPYGFLSLRTALALAGGIPYTGNERNIAVIRGGVECPKIYVIPWKFALHEPNDNLLLIPGDIIYVSQKPITQWNIFLSQLEPTVNLIPAWRAIHRLSK